MPAILLLLYDQLADRWLLTQFTRQWAAVLLSVWRFRRPAIRWDLITVGRLPPAVEIIFRIIRKLECGPTPIISARASSQVDQHS